MSIIRDALRKAQEKTDLESGRFPDEDVVRRPPAGVSRLLIGLAILVGMTVLIVMGWRGFEVWKMRRAALPEQAAFAPAKGSATVNTPPQVSVLKVPPAVSHEEELTRQAETLFWTGDLAGSEKLLREAVGSGKGNLAETANNLGLVLRKKGELGEALEFFDMALERDPNLPEALNNRGVVFRKMKRYRDARTDLEKALQLKPDYGHAQFNLATVLEAQGQTRDAIHYYRKYLNNPYRTPGLDEARIIQRVSALEALVSNVSLSLKKPKKER